MVTADKLSHWLREMDVCRHDPALSAAACALVDELKVMLEEIRQELAVSPQPGPIAARLGETLERVQRVVPQRPYGPPDLLSTQVLNRAVWLWRDLQRRPPLPPWTIDTLPARLVRNEIPQPDDLRRAFEWELYRVESDPEQRPRPYFGALAAAVALLGDAALHRELVTRWLINDKHFYDAQRAYGVMGDDLGERPNEHVARRAIDRSFNAVVSRLPPAVRRPLEQAYRTVRADEPEHSGGGS